MCLPAWQRLAYQANMGCASDVEVFEDYSDELVSVLGLIDDPLRTAHSHRATPYTGLLFQTFLRSLKVKTWGETSG